MTDLKPCPFCGSEAAFKAGYPMDMIKCTNAGCGARILANELCGDRWNTRHPDTRAAVVKLIEKYAGEAELGIAFNQSVGDATGVARHHHCLNRMNALLENFRALADTPQADND